MGGSWLSRLKRLGVGSKDTYEVLEDLERDIEDLELYRRDTQLRQKHCIGYLLLCSALVYLVIAVFFYLQDSPSRNVDEFILQLLPFIAFPVIVYTVRAVLLWLFAVRLELNDRKLHDQRRRKRDILSEVKSTETYKNAMRILERFDPPEGKDSPNENEAVHVRYRGVPSRDAVPTPKTTPQSVLRSSAPHRPMVTPLPIKPAPPPPAYVPAPAPGQLVRPILPKDRSVVDKLVDYLLGDGPSNRCALICSKCHNHNGMALAEEFEFLTFRCCYCFALNPARRRKPAAPQLNDSLAPAHVDYELVEDNEEGEAVQDKQEE